MSSLSELTDIFLEFLNSYYPLVMQARAAGDVTLTPQTEMLFPTMLLTTETEGHYIFELLGASPTFLGLEARRHKEHSVNRYVSQLSNDSSQAHLNIDVGYIFFDGIGVGNKLDLQILAERFPAINSYVERYKLERRESCGALVKFGPSVEFCGFADVIFVHRMESAFRVKHSLYMAVLSKTISSQNVKSHLESTFFQKRIMGVHFCGSHRTEQQIVAGQLQSMFLQPNLRETALGEFLRHHESVLLKAFSATAALHEPYFPWQINLPGNSDTAINPDLLLKRNDGYFDIVDLKTALINRSSLTKGPQKRRRFIDCVSEGLAQLAHYRDFFSYDENAKYAKEKYQVDFKDPQCTLIVGNYENASRQECVEALRAVNNIAILDYDTMIQMYLADK